MILEGKFWVAYSPNGSLDVWRDEPVQTQTPNGWVWCDGINPSSVMHWADFPDLRDIEIDGVLLKPGSKAEFEVRNGVA